MQIRVTRMRASKTEEWVKVSYEQHLDRRKPIKMVFVKKKNQIQFSDSHYDLFVVVIKL